MYNFIKIQFRLGKLTAEQVREFAPKWITAEQAAEIIGNMRTNEGVTDVH